jgi:hypothetical protein
VETATRRPNGRQKAEKKPVESWIRAVGRLLRSVGKRRWYGTIRIEVFDGRVTRVLLEKSIVDPDALAREESDPLDHN